MEMKAVRAYIVPADDRDDAVQLMPYGGGGRHM